MSILNKGGFGLAEDFSVLSWFCGKIDFVPVSAEIVASFPVEILFIEFSSKFVFSEGEIIVTAFPDFTHPLRKELSDKKAPHV